MIILKKNDMGFFLAETIVMVALVTTVMAFVFPNVSKIYDNYKNQMKYYDQTEDIYVLKAVYENLKAKNSAGSSYECADSCESLNNSTLNYDAVKILAYNSIDYSSKKASEWWRANGLSELYIVKYLAEPSSTTNLSFNRYLKRMKRTTNDVSAYRLIGVFDTLEGGSVKSHRYASIKIQKAW